MSWRVRIILVGLALAGLSITACGGEKDSMSVEKQSDLAALGRLIKLPAQPEKAEWQTRKRGEGSDWELVALLTFAPGAYDQAVAVLPPLPQLDGHVGFEPFDWVPTDLPGLGRADKLLAIESGARSAEAFQSPPLAGGFALAVPATRQVLVFLNTL